MGCSGYSASAFCYQSSATFGRHFLKNLYSQCNGVGGRGDVWDLNWLPTKILREIVSFHGSRVQENLLNLTLSSKDSGHPGLESIRYDCSHLSFLNIWKGSLSILFSG